jgi:hypothetical protein
MQEKCSVIWQQLLTVARNRKCECYYHILLVNSNVIILACLPVFVEVVFISAIYSELGSAFPGALPFSNVLNLFGNI